MLSRLSDAGLDDQAAAGVGAYVLDALVALVNALPGPAAWQESEADRQREELKQEFLPRVATGEWTFSYALSEREAGSDAAAMKTRAVRDGDDYVLNGTKCWITGAGAIRTRPDHWPDLGGLDGFFIVRLITP